MLNSLLVVLSGVEDVEGEGAACAAVYAASESYGSWSLHWSVTLVKRTLLDDIS